LKRSTAAVFCFRSPEDTFVARPTDGVACVLFCCMIFDWFVFSSPSSHGKIKSRKKPREGKSIVSYRGKAACT
jgi:hypothetical protein